VSLGYKVVADEGLLDFRRGRGVTVVGTPPQGAVHQHARELLELARKHGYRRHELLDLIESLP
jgi:GntR family transcriptional regulator